MKKVLDRRVLAMTEWYLRMVLVGSGVDLRVGIVGKGKVRGELVGGNLDLKIDLVEREIVGEERRGRGRDRGVVEYSSFRCW